MSKERAWDLIFAELKKAEDKFPGWPDDPVHGAAILVEEAGELVKASLDFYYGRHDGIDQLEKEAAQTGAMAIRFLLGLHYVRAARAK
jgi:NTP pyrophosphatase (non-canonical NTP hydrolase)